MKLSLPTIDGRTLMSTWNRLRKVPGGRMIFSQIIGRTAPYTGTIKAKVEFLEPRFARLTLIDRRAVRNHLGSVHALALANLIEETSGLAMLSGIPPGTRGIITRLDVEYLKKARGTLTAECQAPIVNSTERRAYQVCATVKNVEGVAVSRGTVTWLIGPK